MRPSAGPLPRRRQRRRAPGREKAGHSWVREVAVPNLAQPQLQQVGIRLCGDTLHARVLLRSGGQTTESQPVSLVEDRN